MKKGRTINMTVRSDGRLMKRITVMERGRKVQKTFYGKTERELLQKIAAYEEKSEGGPLFSEIADQYWAQAEKELADNSISNYKPAYFRARKELGDLRIGKIEPADLRRFMDSYIEHCDPARKTAATQRQMLRNIFAFAFEKGYINANPADGLKIKKNLAQTSRDLPTDKEIKAVKENWDQPFGMVAYWVLYTGLRRGELLALTWDDVDFDRNFITVNKSLYYSKTTGKMSIKKPKTEKGIRTVPLMSALREKLKPAKGLVICNSDGSPLTGKQFEWRWAKYCAAAGIDCTPHQIRHGYATMLFDNRIDPKDAQELLGHAQLSTTMDIYTHIRDARKERIRDRLIDVDFDV